MNTAYNAILNMVANKSPLAAKALTTGDNGPIANSIINLTDYKSAISLDPNLDSKKKSYLTDPEFIEHLKNGAIGAGILYLISSFLHLNKKTQILLTALGFGLGNILWNQHNQFSTLDKKTKTYQINEFKQ